MNFVIAQLEKNKTVFQNLLKVENEELIVWKQAPEKWCLLEIACHLLDEEIYDFRFRTQWVLDKPNQTPPPIDPIDWVTKHNYINQDYLTMANKLLDEREKSITWLRSLKNPKWNLSYKHSKLGTLTAKHFLTNWLAHDYLHMKQILKLKYDYVKYKSDENLDYAGIWK